MQITKPSTKARQKSLECTTADRKKILSDRLPLLNFSTDAPWRVSTF
ncbi:MAG: hypothetical protein KME17_31180 [Cyanosarcina radialis HA8281-LM2]|jgi:hypothetical protein|nr:hypothetical protein [Cyanosarcina radialis HA8281-LM2]